MWLKMNPDPMLEQGGDKRLLRLSADSLGLTKSAWRVKRAMQFGTRSSQLGGRIKGYGAGKRTIDNFEVHIA
jgi:hypothetical protein